MNARWRLALAVAVAPSYAGAAELTFDDGAFRMRLEPPSSTVCVGRPKELRDETACAGVPLEPLDQRPDPSLVGIAVVIRAPLTYIVRIVRYPYDAKGHPGSGDGALWLSRARARLQTLGNGFPQLLPVVPGEPRSSSFGGLQVLDASIDARFAPGAPQHMVQTMGHQRHFLALAGTAAFHVDFETAADQASTVDEDAERAIRTIQGTKATRGGSSGVATPNLDDPKELAIDTENRSYQLGRWLARALFAVALLATVIWAAFKLRRPSVAPRPRTEDGRGGSDRDDA